MSDDDERFGRFIAGAVAAKEAVDRLTAADMGEFVHFRFRVEPDPGRDGRIIAHVFVGRGPGYPRGPDLQSCGDLVLTQEEWDRLAAALIMGEPSVARLRVSFEPGERARVMKATLSPYMARRREGST